MLQMFDIRYYYSTNVQKSCTYVPARQQKYTIIPINYNTRGVYWLDWIGATAQTGLHKVQFKTKV